MSISTTAAVAGVVVVVVVGLSIALSVGHCVIPCVFWGKSVKHTFSCRKNVFCLTKKQCFQFFLLF